MAVTYYPDLVQGSDEWKAVRCGLLTASEMSLIVSPTLKLASNDKERAHLYELLAQRITRYVEPHYISDDMLRGHEDELDAKIAYNDAYAPVRDMGFITNDKWGFTLGYSPDGLIGDDGLIEIKSRRQKYQIQTIVEYLKIETAPPEYMLQIQTGLLVSEREWCDFISYCGGLPMVTIRVYPIPEVQEGILTSAAAFEERMREKMSVVGAAFISPARLLPTERRIEQEITL